MPSVEEDATKPFVNRKEAIALFEQLIDFSRPTDKPFLQFYGMSGIGKSFLIEHLKRTYLTSVPTVYSSFEPGVQDHSYESFLLTILRTLRPKLEDPTPLDRFKEKSERWRAECRVYINKIENSISASDEGKIEIVSNAQSVALEKVKTELRHRLTDEFLDAVAEVGPPPLLIVLDAIENLIPETQSEREAPDYAGWLINFLPRFSDCVPSVRVVLSGRRRLTYDSLNHKCNALKLLHLPKNDVVEYLQRIGINDAALIDAIYSLTDGYSLSVGMAGDLWEESGGTLTAGDLDTEEFRASYRNEMIPELLMRRIMERADSGLKPLIKSAGILRSFTFQMLKGTFIPHLKEEDFQRFERYSFIAKAGKYYHYQPELRRLITDNLAEQSPLAFRRKMTVVHQYFVDREEGDLDGDERFYYGVYAKVEGVFDDWATTCRNYYNTWQTEKLKMLVEMTDEINRPFSKREWATICSVRGRYLSRFYAWDKALEYYGKSEKILIEVGDKAGLGPTYNNIGLIYSNKGEWDKALEYYGKSEKILIEVGDKAGLGPTYNNIGGIYGNKGEWDKALEYYGKSEKILIEVGDKAGLGPTYNNIGGIYDNKGEWDKALEYYGKSEKIRIEVGDKAGLGPTYNNIGGIYDNKGEWDKALEYYGKSEKIRIEVGDKAGLGPTYNNIGLIYDNKGEWDKALEYYLKDEKITIEVGDKAGLGPTYNNIGLIYDNKGEWDKALEYYGKSEKIRIEVGDKAGLGPTYNNIGGIYSKKGEWDKALEYYGKSEKIRIEVGDKAGLSTTYRNIALCYLKQKIFEETEKYLAHCVQIEKEIGHPNYDEDSTILERIRELLRDRF